MVDELPFLRGSGKTNPITHHLPLSDFLGNLKLRAGVAGYPIGRRFNGLSGDKSYRTLLCLFPLVLKLLYKTMSFHNIQQSIRATNHK